MTTPQIAYADLSPLAKLVLFLDSLPDPDDAPVTPPSSEAKRGEPEGGSAVNRTDLRDRLGRIITIDRAGTPRSISAPRSVSNV